MNFIFISLIMNIKDINIDYDNDEIILTIDKSSFYKILYKEYKYIVYKIIFCESEEEEEDCDIFDFNVLYNIVDKHMHERLRNLINNYRIGLDNILRLLEDYENNKENIITTIKYFDDLWKIIIENKETFEQSYTTHCIKELSLLSDGIYELLNTKEYYFINAKSHYKFKNYEV